MHSRIPASLVGCLQAENLPFQDRHKQDNQFTKRLPLEYCPVPSVETHNPLWMRHVAEAAILSVCAGTHCEVDADTPAEVWMTNTSRIGDLLLVQHLCQRQLLGHNSISDSSLRRGSAGREHWIRPGLCCSLLSALAINQQLQGGSLCKGSIKTQDIRFSPNSRDKLTAQRLLENGDDGNKLLHSMRTTLQCRSLHRLSGLVLHLS
mmetsp:Transcript_89938/g.173105  ORF Transcript_89938/g.173105 Transcript_89938/m.173105 type:complete len:206 (+) Transcript_89938:597-1214(+)